jgi:ribosomal protein L28
LADLGQLTGQQRSKGNQFVHRKRPSGRPWNQMRLNLNIYLAIVEQAHTIFNRVC